MTKDPASKSGGFGCSIGCGTFIVICLFASLIFGVNVDEMPHAVYYVAVLIAVVVAVLAYRYQRGLYTDLEKVDLLDDEVELYRTPATYYGGHKTQGEKADVQLILTSKRVIARPLGAPVFLMYVDLTSVTDFGMDTKERLTAARMLLVGILAFAMKKQDKYLWIKYTDRNGFEQNPVFGSDFHHQLSEFQSKLYSAIANARAE
ncbi:MAG: hypothetical protein KKG33_13095 [candidate division Zixibacteria bacterium]|nr:hypothetical protein [candidate division Zixibacteria bacterium]MBU1470123.1 hypothetical protein [candidate division Zixibacteria bacterium]MBU2626490.1 hypothetical protein [candidate division Zixibacteria bacterium]